MGSIKMTTAQLREIDEKIRELRDIDLPRARKDYERAASNGDMRENEEADSARNKIASLKGILAKLETVRSQAVICQDKPIGDLRVEFGSKLKVSIDSQIRDLEISESGIDFLHTTNGHSPLGAKLLGKSIGDKFTYMDRLGKRHMVQILEVH